MIHRVSIEQLQDLMGRMPVIDVRSPGEFLHGHIPGAFNLPLFTDEERERVGITYKQSGQQAAILLGLDLTGPKWSDFIRHALEITSQKIVVVHCWRGGMRSSAMAWAFNLYGFVVFVLDGGYKAYRHWAFGIFGRSYRFMLVGGMTGSGKTKILHELARSGEQTIDLESLANHQGSAYGTMNQLVQPTQEQFENDLAAKLNVVNENEITWIEDESLLIGKRMIPKALWIQMSVAMLFDIQMSREMRVANLVSEYGNLDRNFLIECTQKIRKRMGFDNAQKAIVAIKEERMKDFIELALVYYDKTYQRARASRDQTKIVELKFDSDNISCNATQLLSCVAEIK